MKFIRTRWFFLWILALTLAVQVPAEAQNASKGKSLTVRQKRKVSRKNHKKPAKPGLDKNSKLTRADKQKMKANHREPKPVKEARKKEKQKKKAYERARKKEIKRRYKMQTPETQKRMKQTRKEANRYNRGGPTFWERLFGGGKKNKKKKKEKNER